MPNSLITLFFLDCLLQGQGTCPCCGGSCPQPCFTTPSERSKFSTGTWGCGWRIWSISKSCSSSAGVVTGLHRPHRLQSVANTKWNICFKHRLRGLNAADTPCPFSSKESGLKVLPLLTLKSGDVALLGGIWCGRWWDIVAINCFAAQSWVRQGRLSTTVLLLSRIDWICSPWAREHWGSNFWYHGSQQSGRVGSYFSVLCLEAALGRCELSLTYADLKFDSWDCQKPFYVVNMCNIIIWQQWVQLSKYLIQASGQLEVHPRCSILSFKPGGSTDGSCDCWSCRLSRSCWMSPCVGDLQMALRAL